MFRFLQIQFKIGRLSKEELKTYVPKLISEEQYKKIVEDEYAAGEK